MGGESISGKVGRDLRRRDVDDTPDWYTPSEDPLHSTCDRPLDLQRDPTKDGGTVLEQFAKSSHGRNIYHLQKDGISIAETQAEMTKFQERVYITAKTYWSEKEKDEADSPSVGNNAARHL